uniref:NADH-ubiquinone oxidoreductase chain 2 n=1 Tax=Dicronychus cinereus TaxID=942002 RepID=A0A343C2X1_9COLE|nr:NADH dehydrogenase subunit 2 [Dicronychus cinereus]
MPKLYKILFLTSTFMGTLISISSHTWLGMWMGLEINLLSIIPLLSTKKNILSNESAMKYFIVQAIASTMVMISIIMASLKINMQSNINFEISTFMIMNSALLTKMGMAPFHFWFPEVMEGQLWSNCLLILTWQKIAPMIILMYNLYSIYILSTFIILALVISGVMGINQISLRKILAYSSINHMGWMISSMMFFKTIWIIYFTVYSVISINIILILKKFKILFLNQLFQSMNSHPMMKVLFIINFLSLSGIPPFLGFMPKWLTIQTMLEENSMFMPTTMIILTLITVYMYTRITLSSLIMNSNENSWNNFNKESSSQIMIASFNFISLSSLIGITLMFNFS